MIDKKKLETLKNKLLKKQKDIERSLKTFAKKNPALKDDYETRFPNYGPDLDDKALETEAYLENLPVEYRMETRLQRIKKALKKIEEGKYGICEKCGKPISIRRLMIVPEARYCIKCENLIDKQRARV